MTLVDSKKLESDQAYEARGVIGRYHAMGFYEKGPLLRVPVYRFLTLDAGPGRNAIPVEFIKPAPVIEDKGETVLDTASLREGDFVVHPGFVYRKCPWNDNLMAAHMKALQTYRPKTIIEREKADAPAIDLGTFDHTKDQVTKQ